MENPHTISSRGVIGAREIMRKNQSEHREA